MPVATSSAALQGNRSAPYKPPRTQANQHSRSPFEPASPDKMQAVLNLKRYHKNWSDHRNSRDAVTLISSTGLLFAVQDFYLKANSPVFGSELQDLTFLNSERATSRPVDLQQIPPHVISLFLDLVVHEHNRLSSITKAEQYLQVKAFAERYAVGRLISGLQAVRDKVKDNDPFGFMKILTDEAVSRCRAQEIKGRVQHLIADLQTGCTNDKQLISDSIWSTTNKALVSNSLPPDRSRAKGSTKSASTKLSPDMQSKIAQGVSEILAEVQRIYDTYEGKEEARRLIYKSEEMRETIQALQYHFYITSENHFPARWSSYGETTYSNNVVESDTPAHALPTQVAKALGIPFYRAFTFSLDDALVQQNFRSGYTRAPQDPPPFRQEEPANNQFALTNEASIEPCSESEETHPTEPNPNALLGEAISHIAGEMPSQEENRTAHSCAAPYQTHVDDAQTPEQQDYTFRQPTLTPLNDTAQQSVDLISPPKTIQSSTPTSNTATQDMPPPTTRTQRKLGKKSVMNDIKREEENDTSSAFDRRDDQIDEGEQLWMDVWKGIEEYLPIELEMSQFGTSLTVWDEVEDLSAEDQENEEDDTIEDIEMTGHADD